MAFPEARYGSNSKVLTCQGRKVRRTHPFIIGYMTYQDFPWGQLAAIAGLTLLVTGLSAIQPLWMIQQRSITDVLGTL